MNMFDREAYSGCGKEWVLCNNPRKIRHVIQQDLGLFMKSASSVVCVAEEEPC